MFHIFKVNVYKEAQLIEELHQIEAETVIEAWHKIIDVFKNPEDVQEIALCYSTSYDYVKKYSGSLYGSIVDDTDYITNITEDV